MNNTNAQISLIHHPASTEYRPHDMTVMKNQSIGVMIVEDHTMVRKGLKLVLEEFEGIRVIGEAANGLRAIELVKQLKPDVVLMDLGMPDMDGIEAIKSIMSILPDQHIIVL